ncbi:autotransporter domain-containing protein [Oryzomicrobium sp.]|uniref:autotransporter domain-containing protein n=1 Tax=Oryzomicrobium sp. TaxID=1911578 RepID=UPI002FE15449
MSGDGSVIAGSTENTAAGNAETAVLWTNGGTTSQLLATPANTTSSAAQAISLDGSTLVGWGIQSGNRIALLWTSAGVSILPSLAGATTDNKAEGISATGQYAVGFNSVSNQYEAVRWDIANNSVTALGQLAGGMGSMAKAISADGAIVAGTAFDSLHHQRAFVWREATPVMTELPMLTGAYNQSSAEAISSNGSTVVGLVYGSSTRAVYWTVDSTTATVHDLGTLPGKTDSWATNISANGQVIIGHSSNGGNDQTAFRWTQANGMQSVAQWLGGFGVSLPSGWHLLGASAINQDGKVIAGDGTDANGNFIAWLAREGSGLLPDVKAYNASVVESVGKSAHGAASSTSLTLGGAHHRSLRDSSGLAVTQDGACAWATTDVAHHNKTDTTMNLVEAGACKDIGATRLGLGVGQAWSRQGWSLGGNARYNGQYLIAEAASDLGRGIEVSLLGYYGRFATDMKRNYQNGAGIDTSKGTPDATSTALRLRADWKDAFALSATRFSPYAAYTWTDARVDGYTETGGGFPARFNATTQRSQDVRLGLAARTPLTTSTDLRVAAEAAHRIDESGSGASGQVIGLWSFNQPGQKISQNWTRLLVDLDHRIGKSSLINLSASAATSGGDASWGASLGYRMAF